ncbi:MAG: AAA family ATPase [Rickettsiaceae bacterium]|nr:AAA family ATPase [Rickettsiaceae bacterium]
MLSDNLEYTLRKALLIATKNKHEYATYEHLLLALIEDDDASKALIDNGVAIELLTIRLQQYLNKDLADLVNKEIKAAKPTAGFQRVIQRTTLHNQGNIDSVITGAHVLAEFFFENDSYALLCLKESNINRSDLLNYIKKLDKNHEGLNNSALPSTTLLEDPSNESSSLPKLEQNIEDSEKSELEKYCINLNERADIGAIDCLIGRQNEIQRTIEILCRRKKNNAILIGEPGVGKTAIAEGMATRIVKKDVPEHLKDAVIYSLDIGALVAGTKFRGDFEERIKKLLKELQENKNAILFIDEIHTIIGAGSTTTGALDASNLLKPALAKGELHCIGSTTFKEYTNHFEKDAALVRRFQKIVVSEPDVESSIQILQGLKEYYEDHHNVKYTDSAIRAAVTLSERYIHDRHLPDKAIDLIDEAGSVSKMIADSKHVITITEKDIELLLSRVLNITKIRSDSSEIMQLKTLNSKLKNCIFGQDEAIEKLCTSIKLSRAGLRRSNKPTGCYLFAGPTGVGKTELAKQLAIFCNMKLLKFDMSEFSESSSTSKLLGSAPGYVGYDQGGMLSSEVSKYPYSVVLFDEIEKAHSEIYNLLLQIMDEGTLTDSNSKHINFTHTIIIMTTNVLAENEKPSIGFNDNNNDTKPEINMDEINEVFSPEFRSRLDNIIIFNQIDGVIDKIVSKNLKELAAQLADKKVRLTVGSHAKKHLIENYYNKNTGSRDLDRAIDSIIKQQIADEILFGKLRNGGSVYVDFSQKTKKMTFDFMGISKVLKKQPETT